MREALDMEAGGGGVSGLLSEGQVLP